MSGAWIEVRVDVPVGWQELVAETLAQPPCTSVLFGLASLGSDPLPPGTECVRTFFAEEEDGDALRAELTERLASLVRRCAAPELTQLVPQFRLLPKEDYVNSWRKTWRPFRVGHLCVVTPDGEHPLRDGDLPLLLEPGAAFGTGRHCTTRSCLLALQERLRPDARVLDAGAGSGILTVAAARLGAALALGFDVDPRSRVEGTALAEQNGVAQRCEFREGGFEVLEPTDGPFDTVLANLYSDLLQAHAVDLAAQLAPNGWFAFSGCPDRHADATAQRISDAGLAIEEVRQRGRWVTFLGRHAARVEAPDGGARSPTQRSNE